jgi:protein-S-isoprenylcysteine O-methyltransferase Ste14
MILLQGKLLATGYLILFGAWMLSSVVTLVRMRARTGLAARDRGFVARALLVLLLTNFIAIACLKLFPRAMFATVLTSVIGLVLMGLGLAVRSWAMVHLGRYFTVDVAVAADQRIVDTGPYRLVRHPSYTGLLLLAVGVGLCFGNIASFLVIAVPMIALMLKRMKVEEEVLAEALGNTYREYMARTQRLIPGIY